MTFPSKSDMVLTLPPEEDGRPYDGRHGAQEGVRYLYQHRAVVVKESHGEVCVWACGSREPIPTALATHMLPFCFDVQSAKRLREQLAAAIEKAEAEQPAA